MIRDLEFNNKVYSFVDKETGFTLKNICVALNLGLTGSLKTYETMSEFMIRLYNYGKSTITSEYEDYFWRWKETVTYGFHTSPSIFSYSPEKTFYRESFYNDPILWFHYLNFTAEDYAFINRFSGYFGGFYCVNGRNQLGCSASYSNTPLKVFLVVLSLLPYHEDRVIIINNFDSYLPPNVQQSLIKDLKSLPNQIFVAYNSSYVHLPFPLNNIVRI